MSGHPRVFRLYQPRSRTWAVHISRPGDLYDAHRYPRPSLCGAVRYGSWADAPPGTAITCVSCLAIYGAISSGLTYAAAHRLGQPTDYAGGTGTYLDEKDDDDA